VADCTVEDTSNAGIAVFRNSGVTDPGLQSTSISITGGTIRRAGWGADAGTTAAGPNGTLRFNGPFWFSGGILVAEAKYNPPPNPVPDGWVVSEPTLLGFYPIRRHQNVSIMGVAIEEPYFTGITVHGTYGVTIANCPIHKPRMSGTGAPYAIFIQKCQQVSVSACPVTGAENVTHAAFVDDSIDVCVLPNPSTKPNLVNDNCSNRFWHDSRQKLYFEQTPLWSPAGQVIGVGPGAYFEAEGYRKAGGTPILINRMPATSPLSGEWGEYAIDIEARQYINYLMQCMKDVKLMAP